MKDKCKYIKYIIEPELAPSTFDLEKHLERCESCQKQLEQLNLTIEGYSKTKTFSNKEIVYSKIIDAITKEELIIEADTVPSFFEYFAITLRKLLKPVPALAFILFIISGTLFFNHLMHISFSNTMENKMKTIMELSDSLEKDNIMIKIPE